MMHIEYSCPGITSKSNQSSLSIYINSYSIKSLQIPPHLLPAFIVEAEKKYPINQMAVRLQRYADEYAKIACYGSY